MSSICVENVGVYSTELDHIVINHEPEASGQYTMRPYYSVHITTNTPLLPLRALSEPSYGQSSLERFESDFCVYV